MPFHKETWEIDITYIVFQPPFLHLWGPSHHRVGKPGRNMSKCHFIWIAIKKYNTHPLCDAVRDLPLDLLLQLGDHHQVPRLAALQAVLSHEVLGLLEVGTQDRVEDEIGNLKMLSLHILSLSL